MHRFRLFTGVLALSLVSSVVLGNSFHGQQNVHAQESHHLVEHLDSIETHEIANTLSLDTAENECHESTAQLAITSPTGQRFSPTEAAGIMQIMLTGGGECQRQIPRLFTGRELPLFEHASLFAATISMRV